jgi:hypothetical protein
MNGGQPGFPVVAKSASDAATAVEVPNSPEIASLLQGFARLPGAIRRARDTEQDIDPHRWI